MQRHPYDHDTHRYHAHSQSLKPIAISIAAAWLSICTNERFRLLYFCCIFLNFLICFSWLLIVAFSCWILRWRCSESSSDGVLRFLLFLVDSGCCFSYSCSSRSYRALSASASCSYFKWVATSFSFFHIWDSTWATSVERNSGRDCLISALWSLQNRIKADCARLGSGIVSLETIHVDGLTIHVDDTIHVRRLVYDWLIDRWFLWTACEYSEWLVDDSFERLASAASDWRLSVVSAVPVSLFIQFPFYSYSCSIWGFWNSEMIDTTDGNCSENVLLSLNRSPINKVLLMPQCYLSQLAQFTWVFVNIKVAAKIHSLQSRQ